MNNQIYRIGYPEIPFKNRPMVRIIPKNDRKRLNYTIYTENEVFGSIRDFAVCYNLKRNTLFRIIKDSFCKSNLDLTGDELEITLKCPVIDESGNKIGRYIPIRIVLSNQDRNVPTI